MSITRVNGFVRVLPLAVTSKTRRAKAETDELREKEVDCTRHAVLNATSV